MPNRFVWRGHEYAIAEVLEVWKETSGCTHGSAEQYVRKHWFTVRTDTGHEMKLYFERQARSRRQRTARWWLHSLTDPEDERKAGRTDGRAEEHHEQDEN